MVIFTIGQKVIFWWGHNEFWSFLCRKLGRYESSACDQGCVSEFDHFSHFRHFGVWCDFKARTRGTWSRFLTNLKFYKLILRLGILTTLYIFGHMKIIVKLVFKSVNMVV